MKRTRTQDDSPGDFIIYEDLLGEPLRHQSNTLISPSKDSNPRHSKIRRHGSKILSVLRSLTNSGKSPTSPRAKSPLSGKTRMPNELSQLVLTNEASSVSHLEAPSTPPPQMGNAELARELAKKVSMSFNNMRPSSIQPTVVIRSPKSRPSLVSLDKGMMELTPEVSPSTSGETSGNSAGKQSAPARTNSTGMTSLDSKFSAGMKLLSGHSSNTENKKALVAKQLLAEETTVNNSLTPISEGEVVHDLVLAPVPVPSKPLPNLLLCYNNGMDFHTLALCSIPSGTC